MTIKIKIVEGKQAMTWADDEIIYTNLSPGIETKIIPNILIQSFPFVILMGGQNKNHST